MRFLKYLQEKYLMSLDADPYFEEERLSVYVNPDVRDMNQFRLNGMRFIADQFKKNLYVWDEEVEIHAWMMARLVKKGLIPITHKSIAGPLLTGMCQVSGPKMIITDIFVDKDIRGKEWNWLDQYFSNRKEKPFRK